MRTLDKRITRERTGYLWQTLETQSGEVPTLGIGMLGYAFMGKAHSNAFKTLDYIYTPPPAHPSLVAIGGQQSAAGGGRRAPLRVRERRHRLA